MMLEKKIQTRLHHPLSLYLYLCSRFRLFPHVRTLTRPDPEPQSQKPGQDRQHRKVQTRTGLDWTGRDRAGQGRAGKARHRHNSASSDPHIASAKYRITVSHVPSFLLDRHSWCEARRGEARPESEPEVNLGWDWELHSRPFSPISSRSASLPFSRSVSQSTSQSIQIYHPSRQPASAHSSTHLFLSLSAPSLCSLPPNPPFSNPPIFLETRLGPPWSCLDLFLSAIPEFKTSIQGCHPLRVIVGDLSDRIRTRSHTNTPLRILE